MLISFQINKFKYQKLILNFKQAVELYYMIMHLSKEEYINLIKKCLNLILKKVDNLKLIESVYILLIN